MKLFGGKKEMMKEGFSLTIGVPELSYVEMRLGKFKDKAPKTLASALNDTMNRTAAVIGRKAHKEYAYKFKASDAAGEKFRAKPTMLAAKIEYRGRPIPLDRFNYDKGVWNYNKPGTKLSARIKKKGALKFINRAFEIDLHGKKIFRRIKKKNKDGTFTYTRKIQRLFGPSIPAMVNSKTIKPAVKKYAVDTLRKRLDYHIKKTLSEGYK